MQGSWYGNVVYLGKEQNIPILTMTWVINDLVTYHLSILNLAWYIYITFISNRCSLSDIERFKSGKLPLHAPNKAYANTLIKGLVEGEQLSEVEAMAYIDAASAAIPL